MHALQISVMLTLFKALLFHLGTLSFSLVLAARPLADTLIRAADCDPDALCRHHDVL